MEFEACTGVLACLAKVDSVQSGFPIERTAGDGRKTIMPDYRHRRIQLTPRRQADGTWFCPYRIIEFRQTCWGFHQGCVEGSFSSREEAEARALEAAKHIVDSLEPVPQIPRSTPRSSGELYRNLNIKFANYFLHEMRNLGKSKG